MGIKRWPHRQVRTALKLFVFTHTNSNDQHVSQLQSLNNMIKGLQSMLSPSGDNECIKEAIQQIEQHVTSVVQDPSYEIPKNVFRLRQAQFKVRKTLLPHSRSFNSNILLPMSFRISTMQSGGSGATKIATTMIFQLKKEDGELYLSPRYSPKFTVQLVHPSI